MDGVGAQPAVEVPRQDPLMNQLPRRQALLEPALSIAAEGNVTNDAHGIGERRLHGMDAEDEQAAIGVGTAGSSAGFRAPGSMPVVRVHGALG